MPTEAEEDEREETPATPAEARRGALVWGAFFAAVLLVVIVVEVLKRR